MEAGSTITLADGAGYEVANGIEELLEILGDLSGNGRIPRA